MLDMPNDNQHKPSKQDDDDFDIEPNNEAKFANALKAIGNRLVLINFKRGRI